MRTLKQKSYQGLKEYLAVPLYLWLVFGFRPLQISAAI
jgi:hypothetical protein